MSAQPATKTKVIEYPVRTREKQPSEKSKPAYDIGKVRIDFPILDRPVHGKRLVYLDNGRNLSKTSSRH